MHCIDWRHGHYIRTAHAWLAYGACTVDTEPKRWSTFPGGSRGQETNRQANRQTGVEIIEPTRPDVTQRHHQSRIRGMESVARGVRRKDAIQANGDH